MFRNEEVEFIWKSPPLLVPAKVLFTLVRQPYSWDMISHRLFNKNRYLPLFTLMTRFLVFQSSLYDPLVRVSPMAGSFIDYETIEVRFRY